MTQQGESLPSSKLPALLMPPIQGCSLKGKVRVQPSEGSPVITPETPTKQNLCGRQFANSYQVSRGIFPLTQKPHCEDSLTLVLPRGRRRVYLCCPQDTGNLFAQKKGTKENTGLAQCLGEKKGIYI